MSELAFVLRRLHFGDRIEFCRGYYGDQWIELRRWWLLWPKTRVRLTAQEISDLKSSMLARRRA